MAAGGQQRAAGNGQPMRSPRGSSSGSTSVQRATTVPPEILGYGHFIRTRVAHGEYTTPDKGTPCSHLKTLKDIFQLQQPQCCIMVRTTDANNEKTQCKDDAKHGAHVYYTNDVDATATIVQIVPTCPSHNNVKGNQKRSDQFPFGALVADGTPFTVRQMRNFEISKGKGKGAGGDKFVNILDKTKDFYYFPNSLATLRAANLLDQTPINEQGQ